ncbi:hypothetical protein D8I24_4878 [Cupriavidus necator H850]|nr:hypothetical protein D8I24_4878 [Cupriavidus necator H850]
MLRCTERWRRGEACLQAPPGRVRLAGMALAEMGQTTKTHPL